MAELAHGPPGMGLEGGCVLSAGSMESSASRTPGPVRIPSKPFAGALIVLAAVAVPTFSCLCCTWGTVLAAGCKRASQANEGFAAVINMRRLPRPRSWGKGLVIIERLSTFIVTLFCCAFGPSPLFADVSATTSCTGFRKGAFSACGVSPVD